MTDRVRAAISGSREPSPSVSALPGFDPGRISLFQDGTYRIEHSDTDAAIAASHDDFLRGVTIDDLLNEADAMRAELLASMLAFRRIAQGASSFYATIAEARAGHIKNLLEAPNGNEA